MNEIDSKKLEAIANFICEKEIYCYLMCKNFNDSLEKNRIEAPCDDWACKESCPFYSKENFLKWITK